MTEFATYDSVTGEIKSTYSISGNPSLPANSIEGSFDPEATYILSGVATARPVMGSSIDTTSITADGVSAATVSSIPSGTTFFAPDGTSQVINDGTLVFTANKTGAYRLRFENFPNVPSEYYIDAV